MYTAPSHLKNLVIKVNSSIKSQVFKEYGDYITVFKFSKSISKLEANWYAEYQNYGGLLFVTDESDNRTQIFNSSKHGYNGELNLNNPEDEQIMKEICLIDSLAKKELILVFQYGGDEKEYAEDNNSETPEDYFDWFVVYESINGKLSKVYEYECS